MVVLILIGLAQLVVLVLLLGTLAELVSERREAPERSIDEIERDTIRSMFRAASVASDIIDGRPSLRDRS